MDTFLNELIKFNNQIVENLSDSIIIGITLDGENKKTIISFYNENFIENIRNIQNEIVSIDQLSNFDSQPILVEFVKAEIKKFGFYIELNDFISSNRFELPSVFYISEIDYSKYSEIPNEKIEKYKTLTKLINGLKLKAKFIAEDYIKTLYLIQENSFLELPIDNIVYEDFVDSKNLTLIDDYIVNIDSYKEKRSIFLKELIDFLTPIKVADRFKHLVSEFNLFYDRCNTSYEYYLSNFSFNRVKLELDNSVLEHSKNIRTIINDSQSKLIAIPAAFVLETSQIDFSDTFCLKNIIVLTSSFLFSYIISIFIKNQKNALEIVFDNVENYKKNYKRSKANIFESVTELVTLTELINNSYIKTDNELKRQNSRINILQFCNWGISIALLITLILIRYITDIENFWQHIIKALKNC